MEPKIPEEIQSLVENLGYARLTLTDFTAYTTFEECPYKIEYGLVLDDDNSVQLEFECDEMGKIYMIRGTILEDNCD
ncbi:MAG: hypothetical protein IE880_05075 [Epsilonproteobacteria bacterium]|nr:hypothetical protein [Campylobacterota bacterium]